MRKHLVTCLIIQCSLLSLPACRKAANNYYPNSVESDSEKFINEIGYRDIIKREKESDNVSNSTQKDLAKKQGMIGEWPNMETIPILSKVWSL